MLLFALVERFGVSRVRHFYSMIEVTYQNLTKYRRWSHTLTLLNPPQRTVGWFAKKYFLSPLYSTALHRSLSKYMTAQYTHGTPTLTKHRRTPAWLGNLLYLQPHNKSKLGFFPVHVYGVN